MPNYRRFATMIAVSMVVMLPLMYLNTYSTNHVFFSETRTFMAVIMGASMAIIMLAFMRSMLTNVRFNIIIVLVSVAAFSAALWLVRSQATVDDVGT